MTVLPARLRTTAPAGICTLPLGPIAVMRLSVITMSPRAITSSPFIVIRRALRSAMMPFGLSLSTTISTSTRCGSYSSVGIFGGAGGFCAAPGFSVGGLSVDGFSVADGAGAAARSASVSALTRFARSTSACVRDVVQEEAAADREVRRLAVGGPADEVAADLRQAPGRHGRRGGGRHRRRGAGNRRHRDHVDVAVRAHERALAVRRQDDFVRRRRRPGGAPGSGGGAGAVTLTTVLMSVPS